jgi:hypothetical protein
MTGASRDWRLRPRDRELPYKSLKPVKERGSHGALRSQLVDDFSRLDREPLQYPSYLVLRLVHPSVQARRSAVRQDAARPA